MKLFGCLNTRSGRVAWTLEEAQASYEYVFVDLKKGEARKPEYLAINADGKVPSLIDGELTLTESAAICIYIADKFPAAELIPSHATLDRARLHQWCFFALSELEQPLWTINKHTFALPEQHRVPAVKDSARFEFARALKVLDAALVDRKFIVGDRFSVADILIAHTLWWARAIKIEIASAGVINYTERMLSRPAYLRAVEREKQAARRLDQEVTRG
jgi:glutathione S-transferase